jgi:hypothetical protein
MPKIYPHINTFNASLMGLVDVLEVFDVLMNDSWGIQELGYLVHCSLSSSPYGA